MSVVEIRLLPLHPNQRALADSPARFTVAACGRRFGKTEAGKRSILRRALDGASCWWLSPTYQMASDVWRALSYLTRDIPTRKVYAAERQILLPGGGRIAVRSTGLPNNLRGAGLDYAVLDEAAFMPPEIWPQIIRPMLLERQGGALFLSTPNGRNWFYDLYQHAQTREDWKAFHFTSYDNPLVSGSELDDIRSRTPERIWREEYLAEFADSAGTVFRYVRENVTPVQDVQHHPDHTYVIGVDWGRESDYTALVVLDVTDRRVVEVDRFNQIGWSLQRGRLLSLARKWDVSLIIAESNSVGSPNIEELQNEGLPVKAFQTTAQSKTAIIEALALALETGSLRLPDDEILLSELLAYRVERQASGAYRYSAPAGQHDDTVIALALAWSGASRVPSWGAFIV